MSVIVFEFFEVREEVFVVPLQISSQSGPVVIVLWVTPHVNHAVKGTRPSKTFATWKSSYLLWHILPILLGLSLKNMLILITDGPLHDRWVRERSWPVAQFGDTSPPEAGWGELARRLECRLEGSDPHPLQPAELGYALKADSQQRLPLNPHQLRRETQEPVHIVARSSERTSWISFSREFNEANVGEVNFEST